MNKRIGLEGSIDLFVGLEGAGLGQCDLWRDRVGGGQREHGRERGGCVRRLAQLAEGLAQPGERPARSAASGDSMALVSAGPAGSFDGLPSRRRGGTARRLGRPGARASAASATRRRAGGKDRLLGNRSASSASVVQARSSSFMPRCAATR